MTDTNTSVDSAVDGKLPSVESYDTATLMSIHDIVDWTKGNMPETKVRALLSLYCLEPVAQRKIPKTRGRGMHLYDRPAVEKVLVHYLSFFKAA